MRCAAANVPAVLAYSANNTVSHSKRGISSAVVIGMGGVGGILAATIYRQVDFPGYLCVPFSLPFCARTGLTAPWCRPGLWATFGCQLLIIALVGTLTLHFRKQNRLADEGKRGPIEGVEGFRYTT